MWLFLLFHHKKCWRECPWAQILLYNINIFLQICTLYIHGISSIIFSDVLHTHMHTLYIHSRMCVLLFFSFCVCRFHSFKPLQWKLLHIFLHVILPTILWGIIFTTHSAGEKTYSWAPAQQWVAELAQVGWHKTLSWSLCLSRRCWGLSESVQGERTTRDTALLTPPGLRVTNEEALNNSFPLTSVILWLHTTLLWILSRILVLRWFWNTIAIQVF